MDLWNTQDWPCENPLGSGSYHYHPDLCEHSGLDLESCQKISLITIMHSLPLLPVHSHGVASWSCPISGLTHVLKYKQWTRCSLYWNNVQTLTTTRRKEDEKKQEKKKLLYFRKKWAMSEKPSKWGIWGQVPSAGFGGRARLRSPGWVMINYSEGWRYCWTPPKRQPLPALPRERELSITSLLLILHQVVFPLVIWCLLDTYLQKSTQAVSMEPQEVSQTTSSSALSA